MLEYWWFVRGVRRERREVRIRRDNSETRVIVVTKRASFLIGNILQESGFDSLISSETRYNIFSLHTLFR